ncbi:MAG: glycosyltransferase [Nannocystis sp.]|nr:glycosyltransferase [Nannocystis sp.]
MRFLVVTEKCNPAVELRDGGARLVTSLRRSFGDDLDVMHFDEGDASSAGDARWRNRYEPEAGDRFERRLARAGFIADRIHQVVHHYTHVLFVHVSMAFGLARRPLTGVETCMFPMFLTPSYVASGECVPAAYTAMERAALTMMDRVLTPSHLERHQIVDFYGLPPGRVRVVPRGVDRELMSPRVRELHGPPVFCSVGSIKRQKNTVGLVRIFAAIQRRLPEARLHVIGPVQDAAYAIEVEQEVERLGLGRAIEWSGHVAPLDMPAALDECHVHLSASTCETFGRAMFETLASGLPNVIPLAQNAAAEHLVGTPYTFFYDDLAGVHTAVDQVLSGYSLWSALALEIGEIFNDDLLGGLLRAEICKTDILAVSDYDGTLYHKDDPERTRRCVAAFERYSHRVICSARPLPDLLQAMSGLSLTAHHVIGWSGAVVADGQGRTLWRSPLSAAELQSLAAGLPSAATPVVADGEALQFALAGIDVAVPPGMRVETYQGTTYFSRWDNSKLHAVHRLLRHLRWGGRVRSFGDGRHDTPLLSYFDGIRIRPRGSVLDCIRMAEEIVYDPS